MSGCAGSQKKTMQQEKENTTMVADIDQYRKWKLLWDLLGILP